MESCLFDFSPRLVWGYYPCFRMGWQIRVGSRAKATTNSICRGGSGSGKNLHWCFTTELVKTDSAGKIITKAEVANHHGDLTYWDGKIYVAVNLGEFNEP